MSRSLPTVEPVPFQPEPTAGLQLPLFGPARLEWQGRTVRLRRKSLAILYYLAIEGATRRELLADLLWERVDPARNLRVELHNLRKALADFGISPFEGSMDPLVLPLGVRLERNGEEGEPFEGLEGLTPSFQVWLEEQRALLEGKSPRLLMHRDLVTSIAKRVRLPYLLILSAEPDAGQDAFVSSLAARLGLHLTTDLTGGGPALRHLSSRDRLGEDVIRAIAADEASLWVVERSSFGEDSSFLLQLRGSYPASRTSYLELPGLTWREVRDQLLDSLSFAEAAELYTGTAGHPGFLRERLELRDRPGERTQLPQRIRAAYQLEARRLSREARYALERASVHPGPMPEGLLRALEVDPHLIELERRNWLILENGWRFKGKVPRVAIYLSLPKGQSRLYHGIAARHFEAEGNTIAAEYHRSRVSGTIDWGRVGEGQGGWVGALAEERLGRSSDRQPRTRRSRLGLESPLLDSRLFGEQVEAQAGEMLIVRQPLDRSASGAEWQLLPRRGILRLRGRAYARSCLDVGIDGDSVPLEVEFLGSRPRRVVLAPVGSPRVLEDGTLLLPLQEEFEYHLGFEECLFVRVSSGADSAVLELTLTAHEAVPALGGEGVDVY